MSKDTKREAISKGGEHTKTRRNFFKPAETPRNFGKKNTQERQIGDDERNYTGNGTHLLTPGKAPRIRRGN